MRDLIIRRMRQQDLPGVCAIEKENFSVPWSEKSFLESMEREDTVFLAAVFEACVVGYLGCYCIAGNAEITNVAVCREFRRKGIGRMLLERLFEEASALQCTEILLEVRESNLTAAQLYRSVGFETISIRKNFYEKPTENAVIMQKILPESCGSNSH